MKMLVTLVRALILYVLIIICMRIMGKRQLGELQPTELVITILLSEIAAIPMQDNALPLGNSIVAVLLLVALEVFNSVVVLKSSKCRSFLQGNSLVVIRDGVVDQKQLKRLRFTMDDLFDQLRQKDVFDISDVRYAIVETNGTINVLSKNDFSPVTFGNLKEISNGNSFKLKNISEIDTPTIPITLIAEGKINKNNLKAASLQETDIKKILEKTKTKNIKNVLILTIDGNGKVYFQAKKGNYQTFTYPYSKVVI